ncbi:Carbamate kinase [ANME-1 cluster archaeon GoMg3.2]|nr:Carbamate kinase [ANME-1 cluster archaeon GoMg3.2]
MIQVEAAAGKVPTAPLHVDVAQSQGSMGYMIAQSLINQLQEHGIDTCVAAVMTQVLVNRDDPAMKHPTKPVGGKVHTIVYLFILNMDGSHHRIPQMIQSYVRHHSDKRVLISPPCYCDLS